ncbi:MAG: hypothetical protein IJT73_09745 [Selenomonadaceae bacterium]|nr:hypothetical protein [Selenomonadaceae bacterium]
MCSYRRKKNVGAPQAPTGKIYINGEITDIGSTGYNINGDGKATFNSQTADKFVMKK